MKTKTCTKCKQDKELTEFNRDRSKKDGRYTYCKVCHRAKQKNWVTSNHEYQSDYMRDYQKRRKAADPTFRWVAQIRCRLRRILIDTGSHQPTLDLLGCTGQEWRDHLESQFTDGMSWDNYGEWHVDHIIPVSAFDQNKLDERAICWHYSNTQPLWAADNMAKGKTIPTE